VLGHLLHRETENPKQKPHHKKQEKMTMMIMMMTHTTRRCHLLTLNAQSGQTPTIGFPGGFFATLTVGNSLVENTTCKNNCDAAFPPSESPSGREVVEVVVATETTVPSTSNQNASP
jgi:hypothetical protein